MGRLTRSQKKGKVSSYTSRFLKKRVRLDGYTFDVKKPFKVVKFFKMPKTKALIMTLECEGQKYNLVAPHGVRKGEVLNDENSKLVVKKLQQFVSGDQVCNIEFRENTRKFMCRAPGTHAKVVGFEKGKVKITIKDRSLLLDPKLKAMGGVVNSRDVWLKPLMKAGTAFKIQRAKGKKYPTVSSTKMNVQDSKLGGSYRKRIGFPLTVSRTAPPGRKVGHLAAKRTGRKKK